MEFGQAGQQYQYSDIKEKDQDQEEEDDHDQVRTTITPTTTTWLPLSFCAPSSSSSKKWPLVTGGDQLLLLNNGENNTGNNHLQLMDYLSLTTSHHDLEQAVETSNSNSISGENRGVWLCSGEREHLFDKVVTPSDVGKLNRLVIPKQHAEKYFPLDSASNEKGLLLNFEDRSGKSWRFRYSYWNSSQSYVMTKGWSRFVKEKKLDAGDIVSFERGVGESARGRLFIDWRRRPHHQFHHHHRVLSNPSSLIPIDHHHHLHPYHCQQRWAGGSNDGGGMLYSLPSSMSMLMPQRNHENLEYNCNDDMIQYLSYNHYHLQQQHHYQYQQQHQLSDHHRQHQYHSNIKNHRDYLNNHHQVSGVSGNHDCAHSAVIAPSVLINSMPAPTVPLKRLRLFGVNMEYCPSQEDQASPDHHAVTMAPVLSPPQVRHDHHRQQHHHLVPSSSGQYPLQVRIPNNPSPILSRPTSFPAEFSHKGKSASSLSFNMDPKYTP